MQNNAMWIATSFGPFLTIIGLWMLFYTDNAIKVWQSFKSTPGAFSLHAALNLLIGLVILSQYDMWTADRYVIVTLLGWFMLLRGVLIFFLPQFVLKMTLGSGKESRFKMVALIPLAWGVILFWMAFLM